MKILAFAGSTSSTSINKKLVEFTCSLFETEQVNLLDLNHFEMTIFSVDREKEGIPDPATRFAAAIDDADIIVMSLAEHNGAYTAAFKNIFDWTSRIPNRTVFENTPILLMAASPGERGGKSVLNMAKTRFPFNGGVILDTFSLPNFGDNFSEDEGIVNETLRSELLEKVKKSEQHVSND